MPCPSRRYFWLPLLLAVLALTGCREEPWNPEVAGLVNGRPISRTAVNRVLEWGFYPQLGQDGERGGALAFQQVLNKLIDEQLILAEAEKAGLVVEDEELRQVESALETAWFGVPPPPAERADLRQALRNQLLLRKMTEKVMAERRVLSAEDWDKFWADWPRDVSRRFLVRALLIPPLVELPDIPARRRGNLDRLAEYFEAEGFSVIVSDRFWLAESKVPPEVKSALETALTDRRPAGPFQLEESWAAYEVLDVAHGPSPEEELRKAARAFEALAGEKAFQAWLKELKAGAEISINPALAELTS